MGCCESLNEKNETFETLILSVLKLYPMSKRSIRECVSIFNCCETEFSSSKKQFLVKGSTFVREYSEDKYNQVIQLLFNINHNVIEPQEKKSEKTSLTIRSSKRSRIIDLSLIPSDTSSTLHNLSKNVSLVYYAITPDYNGLFDSIVLKNKPKALFTLFALGFTNDDVAVKSEYFMKVFKYSDLVPNTSNFQVVLQAFTLINLNFSTKLCDCFHRHKSKLFVEEVGNEFNTHLSTFPFDDWLEYNRELIKKRYKLSLDFSLYYSQMLLYILKNEITEVEFEQHKPTLMNQLLDNQKTLQILEEFNKLNHYEFNESDISLLLNCEPHLFDFMMIRSKLLQIH